jgi:hypothetical protein
MEELKLKSKSESKSKSEELKKRKIVIPQRSVFNSNIPPIFIDKEDKEDIFQKKRINLDLDNYCSKNAEMFYQTEPMLLDILNLTCKIRTRKRTKYYIHEYNPDPILKRIELVYNKEDLNYKFSMFDFESRKNCCFCISITVYFTQKDKEYFETETSLDSKHKDINKYEYRYLVSILQTVNNAKMFLPEWLVRIYMDQSVYQVLKDKKNSTLCQLFDEIFQSENVEIFTFECNVKNLEQTRTYRFLPMIDETVAKVAIREADGYLCKMDCNNIRVFSNSNAIMYLAEYFPNSKSYLDDENDLILPPAYDENNLWLEIYKEYEENFFYYMTNIYSLVAGTITLNVRVKKDYFTSKFTYVKDLISEIKSSGEYPENVFESLDIGFDEIFLLDTFRDFICINRKLDDREYFMLNEFIIGSLNYPTYKVKGDNISKISPELEKLVQQNLLDEVPYIDPNENELDFLKMVDSAVSFDKDIIFNISFVDMDIITPYGNPLEASLLGLLNFQYVYIENKINCVAKTKVFNYRKNNSPKDDCWIGKVINLIDDLNLYDEVYMEEKRYLDQYYQKKNIQSKKKRSSF